MKFLKTTHVIINSMNILQQIKYNSTLLELKKKLYSFFELWRVQFRSRSGRLMVAQQLEDYNRQFILDEKNINNYEATLQLYNTIESSKNPLLLD